MGTIRYLLLMICFWSVCSGCSRVMGDGGYALCESDSFVFGYWGPKENTMYAVAQEHGLISVGCGSSQNQHFGAYSDGRIKGWEDDTGYQRYLDKCGKYSDAGYDTVYYVISSAFGPSDGYHYFAEEIRDVGLSYSLDWGEGFSAGSELGELFTLYAISPLEYIRRGYTDRISCKGHTDEEIFAVIQNLNACDAAVGSHLSNGSLYMIRGSAFDNFYGEPIVRKVSELTEDDLRLVGGGDFIIGDCILFVLKPDFLPEDLSGVLTITVTTDRRTYTVPFNGLAELELS